MAVWRNPNQMPKVGDRGPGAPHFSGEPADWKSRSTLPISESDGEEILAVHVAGPTESFRRLLPSEGIVIVGRGAENKIRLSDPRVSRAHAAIHISKVVCVTDLGSANGTFVNGRRVPQGESVSLRRGESVLVGDSTLTFGLSGYRRTQNQTLPDGVTSGGLSRPRSAKQGPEFLCLLDGPVQERSHARAILEGRVAQAGGTLSLLSGKPGSFLVAGIEFPHVAALEHQVVSEMARWGLDCSLKLLPFSRASCWDGLGENGSPLGSQRALHERGGMVLQDASMIELYRTVQRVARGSVNVLIFGETGVGKEVVASMVHELSPRRQAPFLRLNCASLPDALLESELFGYERGAFTGATSSKKGLLESATGGTVFLDELGELSPAVQAKLLVAIESQEVLRLGGARPTKVDIRFVAATNSDLTEQIIAGKFRQDLFYRINCITLTVPPLRERHAEILPLARLFIARAAARLNVTPPTLSEGASAALLVHRWPGNVRELRNVLERGVLMASAGQIDSHHLGLSEANPTAMRLAGPTPTQSELRRMRKMQLERQEIEQALADCAGNQSRVANLLGIPRRTLVRRLAEYGLSRRARGTSQN